MPKGIPNRVNELRTKNGEIVTRLDRIIDALETAKTTPPPTLQYILAGITYDLRDIRKELTE